MQALKMLSSMASRDVLRELATQFETRHGRRVQLEAAGGVDIAKRLRAGEHTDLVVLARNTIEALAAEQIVRADSVTDLVQSGIGVAVAAGAAVPDISSEAAVRQAVERAPSLSFSTGPSGVYLEKKFEAWGLLEVVRPRIVVPPPGTPVASLVAGGQAALGFQQLSELLHVEGITLVGLLPAGVQLMTTFSGAVARSSADADAGRALLDFLASGDSAATKRRFGMDVC